jgi:DNA-binding transcriptional MerR regulator
MHNDEKKYTMEELCSLAGVSKRTVQYYIQQGMVDRPAGSTGKGAYYTPRHLEQLLATRKWKNAGLSLERIREIVRGVVTPQNTLLPPPSQKKEAGSTEVWSHVHISDGLELHINPQRSGLHPEQIRALTNEIVKLVRTMKTSSR